MTENPPTPPPPTKPSLHLTWEDWLPYLEDDEQPYEARQEFIETIWFIAMAFVDLGWNIRSEQETCGQDFDLAAALRRAVLNSEERKPPNSDETAGHTMLSSSEAIGQTKETKEEV